MTRINGEGIQSLAAIMRAQVQALSRPAGTPTPVPASGTARERDKARKRSKSEDLAANLARRARAIDPADAGAHDKAMQVFLESVLLAEFGENLINDPGFHQIVEGVLQQMRSNAELAVMMEGAARALLGKS